MQSMSTDGPLLRAVPSVICIKWSGAIKWRCWKETKENEWTDCKAETGFAGGMTEFRKMMFGVWFYLEWTKIIYSLRQWTVRIHGLHFQIFSMIDFWDIEIRTPDGSDRRDRRMRSL
jgi:hypothetical protein